MNLRASVIAASAVLVLAGCGGSDASDASATPADPGAPATATADAAPDSSGTTVQANGVELDLITDICALGGDFGSPDDRQFTGTGPTGFPVFGIELFMPDIFTARYVNADGTATYRTSDPADLDVTITDAGAEGTVTMVDSSGQVEDVTITFAFTCDESDTSTDEGGSTGEASGGEEGGTKTGYVDWAGARSDLDDADFDPFAGTGLCETQDVTGTETGDYYRISTQLDDGTDFYLTSDEGLVLGETLSPIETSGLSVTQDGRTVSGSAQTADGPLEFSFSC